METGSLESGEQQVPDPRKNRRRPLGPQKSPLFDNFFLQTLEGQLQGTCGKKKATWYQRNRTIQSEDPFIARLLFKPSGHRS